MGTESSGDQPKVKGDSGRRELRRWEDKAVVAMMTLLIGVICFMWKAQAAQVEKLEERQVAVDKIAAIHSEEISTLKRLLLRIEDKLDKALENRRNP